MERADQLPLSAHARVRDRAYAVRAPRGRATGALAGVAVLGAAAVLTLAGVGNHGAQQASAGWTPIPTQGRTAQTAAAEAVCKADLPAPQRARRAREAMPPGGDPALDPVGGVWRTVLVDTRGSYTMVLLSNGSGGWDNCLSGPAIGASPASGGGQSNNGSEPAPPGGQIKEISSGFSRAADGAPFSYATGLVGAGVQAVTLELAGGQGVTASVGAGWYAAWWPGRQQVQRLQVRTASGTASQPAGVIDRAGR